MLGLGTHARLGKGAGEPEPFQRGGRVVDDGDDPGAKIIEGIGPTAEIDGDDAEIRRVDRDRTDQPGAALAVIDHDATRALGARPLGAPDRIDHRLGDVDIAEPFGLRFQRAAGIEQQHLAADQGLEMPLHGIENAGRRVRSREPLRERIEVANFVFTLGRRGGIAAGAGRKIARHQGDDEKEQNTEEARAILGVVGVERAVEEQRQRDDAPDRGHRPGEEAPANRRDQDRQQESDRDRRQFLDVAHAKQQAVGDDDQQQPRDDPAQAGRRACFTHPRQRPIDPLLHTQLPAAARPGTQLGGMSKCKRPRKNSPVGDAFFIPRQSARRGALRLRCRGTRRRAAARAAAGDPATHP